MLVRIQRKQPRRAWTRKPYVKIKESIKKYKRSINKKILEKETEELFVDQMR